MQRNEELGNGKYKGKYKRLLKLFKKISFLI